MQQIAFVCGVPRSGTTAMAQLLNGHPAVCMGIERYQSSFRDLSPACFTKDRFFDFEPGANSGLYRRMAEKWDSARIVGDKLPLLFKALPRVRERFPGVKIVYMLRNIEAVASSWNRRALDEADAWAAYDDFRSAVRLWNRANRIVARHVQSPPVDVLVVPYEGFFSGDDTELTRLCDFLDIEQSQALITHYWRQVERYRSVVVTKPALPLPGQVEFIRRHADMRLYLALRDGGPVRWRDLISSFRPAHWALPDPDQMIGLMRSWRQRVST